MPPDQRPMIPKIPYNSKCYNMVNDVNDALKNTFASSGNIHQTHGFVYFAALTVCFLLNIFIENGPNTRCNRRNSVPPWKLRLERKIDAMRKHIGVLTHYNNIRSDQISPPSFSHGKTLSS
ncbi:hypothetical protein M8J77_009425 [Diaphorina citri]|nr:hypothetical protein M8J77_009425 [Diaphorina citri]